MAARTRPRPRRAAPKVGVVEFDWEARLLLARLGFLGLATWWLLEWGGFRLAARVRFFPVAERQPLLTAIYRSLPRVWLLAHVGWRQRHLRGSGLVAWPPLACSCHERFRGGLPAEPGCFSVVPGGVGTSVNLVRLNDGGGWVLGSAPDLRSH